MFLSVYSSVSIVSGFIKISSLVIKFSFVTLTLRESVFSCFLSMSNFSLTSSYTSD
jgi:hypothetical protein